jgi:hypothetical protein
MLRTELETAAAEMAFYRVLFFAESPRTPWPSNPTEFTAFSAQYSATRALVLTKPPYQSQAALWTALADYSYCQSLAEQGRADNVDAIRYLSLPDSSRVRT